MADAFIGQIMLCPYTFAPAKWMDCAGQLLSISQNTALFSLLGTAYGGDGRSNFALPNLQSRAAVAPGKAPGQATTYAIGDFGGAENVVLTERTLGAHTHPMNAVSGIATTATAVGNSFAALPTGRGGAGDHLYAPAPANTTLAAAVVQSAGSPQPQPHSNIQPYLALRYIICVQGVFPARP